MNMMRALLLYWATSQLKTSACSKQMVRERKRLNTLLRVIFKP